MILFQLGSSDRVQGSLQVFALEFYNFDSSGIQFQLVWMPFGWLLDAFWMHLGSLLDAFWLHFGARDTIGVHFGEFVNFRDFWKVTGVKGPPPILTQFWYC